MKHALVAQNERQRWPRWWRMFLIGSATLVLCSCRGPHGPGGAPQGPPRHGPSSFSPAPLPRTGPAMPPPQAFPPQAMSPYGMPPQMPHAHAPGMMPHPAMMQGMQQGAPSHTLVRYQEPAPSENGSPSDQVPPVQPQPGMQAAPGMPQGAPAGVPPMFQHAPHGAVPYGPPLPETVVAGPWRPPGIACPWPPGEYLCDGGDNQSPVRVSPDFTVHGLEMEDTIAHYDTLYGSTCVAPSNKVCLYAPRFMAVRSVTGPRIDNQIEQPFGADRSTVLAQHDFSKGAIARMEAIQPGADVAVEGPDQFLGRDVPLAVSTRRELIEFAQGFLPYENFRLLRLGEMDDAERPMLALRVQNAIAWTHNKAVQVLLKDQKAANIVGEERAQAMFVFEPPCPGKIRICKVASTNGALPGEFVDFTLRYDNIGESEVGNVTIIDNLTTRLEYVEGTAQSSRPADFFTTENQGGSLILRWEIIDPVPAGEGGIIRFRCRVR